MAEDMQHIRMQWREVNGVDLPAAETTFPQNLPKKNSMQVTITANITRKVSVNLMQQIFPANLQLTVKFTVL